MVQLLSGKNKAWVFHQVEAPSLIPKELVSKEYATDDIYITQDFYLRPETTAASYAFADYIIDHQESMPPLCIWQVAKSFRRENDQVYANVRLKEFYQQEFQCIVTVDTKMDYQELAEPLAGIVGKLLGLETRVVDSDRLPSYSQRTIDIEAKTPHKWLEICSISKRSDVPFTWQDRELMNYEFAFGLDRCTFVKYL
jgi:glycyl-tRNA synthetase